MGSPNFRTDNNFVLNVGVEFDYEDDCLFDDLNYQYEQSKNFIDSLELWFFDVSIEQGCHSGFQIYIEPMYSNSDEYWQGIVKVWQDYKEFYTKDGYRADLSDCPYFRKGIKNATLHNVKQAIAKEEKYLYKALLTHAQNNGLGVIVGQTWTSHVCYSTLQDLINNV